MNSVFQVDASSSVTSKGQTTIPKSVRDALGIKEGTPLRWRLKDGVLVVTAKTKRLEDFAGLLGKPPNGRQVDIEEMNQAVLDEAADRFRRKTSR
ncbi:AbrB/MazE/SpoVT family DNA-binding domain-containing protein [Devosia sp. YIM 151766]|uniref:AbrB/MazE/SpoVT family DNA-binding domain-containing protein n=1 Tax=Devosia sp. YIM 151766 TaxID=3017325 RepID=UPI00255CB0E8|nr:AbrB/MazE/SpoVT family DNA-binding domain-containing protein [Devosia sp. YIM 151766]WIY52189.1 AbrB/MazE/SpoVT family DNA-binding domain-containing protein [Devosia sp. YIM 151766]